MKGIQPVRQDVPAQLGRLESLQRTSSRCRAVNITIRWGRLSKTEQLEAWIVIEESMDGASISLLVRWCSQRGGKSLLVARRLL